ncbi:TrkH family potassium uptake protein [Acholeplasma granularum]|uniref:TrkH family potassium uptake protein n=1 Tax=Acholeplasma granularum TaxID=264635 RepID=UPI0004B2A0B0|nr:TrkH family potassium uptake protein [Acholeplasma granularum]
MTNQLKTLKGYKLIIGYLGIFLILVGGINLLPLSMLIFYPEDYIYTLNFLIPGISSIVIGYIISRTLKNKHLAKFHNHEDMVFVVLVWVIAIIVSSLPFFLHGFSLTHSIFEATSGLTTTGLSILTVLVLPKIFQFHQMILLFFGGIGLVLIMTSAISDRYGMKLYTAEGHNDKLLSNLAKSAKLIMAMYMGFIIFGAISFKLFGMDLFDAFFYAISAVSTGGFSPHVESISHYNHIGIEIIAMILMLLGATNFLTHLYLLSGKFKKVFNHGITYLFIGIIIIFTSLVTINLIDSKIILHPLQSSSNFEYLRHALFTVISGVTTTGLTTISGFNILPGFSIMLILLLMLIGGQAGSTGGAIKQDRILLSLQSSYWYIKDKMSHNRMIRTNFVKKYDHYEQVTDLDIRHNYAFIFIYFMIWITGSIIIMSQGFNLESSLFDMASAMSNTGFTQGIMHRTTNNFTLWIFILGMFSGRLEFTIIFVTIIKIFKSIIKKEN